MRDQLMRAEGWRLFPRKAKKTLCTFTVIKW